MEQADAACENRTRLGAAPFGDDGPSPPARVVVAMSGGVDSSAAAAMLVEAGYEVVGVTLQLYDHGRAVGRPGSCCAGQDIHDARAVAERLGVPHYVLDYESRFRAAVIDDFADAYARGETPVPCARCNERVKFADLLDTARDLGASALVTGHYVRRALLDGRPALLRGLDPARDQSYFLFATTASQLDLLRFPLGGIEKRTTREIARRFALPVSDKPDSQDICFAPEGGYARVVERLRPEALRPGEIVDEQGAALGRHDGVARFTVGQRRGLKLASPEPLFVLRIEPNSARVVVGPRSALARPRLTVREVNWLGGQPLEAEPVAVSVKLRSAMAPVAAEIRGLGDGRVRVDLAQPYPGVAPGQACVFYDGERMLGGGWICREDAHGRGEEAPAAAALPIR